MNGCARASNVIRVQSDARGERLGPVAPQVREREVEDDLVLYDPASRQAVFLNGPASDVWRLLDGELDLAGVIDTLADAYDVAPEAIEADVLQVVRRLRALRLLPNPDG